MAPILFQLKNFYVILHECIFPYFELYSLEIFPEVGLLDQRRLTNVGYQNAFLRG